MLHVRADPAAQHAKHVAQPAREFIGGQHADPLDHRLGQDAVERRDFLDGRRDLGARGAARTHGDVDLGGAAQEQFLIHACLAPVARRCERAAASWRRRCENACVTQARCGERDP
ncbi:hypothetical protein WJ970_20330 [Achromobacter xylosoxidans]